MRGAAELESAGIGFPGVRLIVTSEIVLPQLGACIDKAAGIFVHRGGPNTPSIKDAIDHIKEGSDSSSYINSVIRKAVAFSRGSPSPTFKVTIINLALEHLSLPPLPEVKWQNPIDAEKRLHDSYLALRNRRLLLPLMRLQIKLQGILSKEVALATRTAWSTELGRLAADTEYNWISDSTVLSAAASTIAVEFKIKSLGEELSPSQTKAVIGLCTAINVFCRQFDPVD